MHNIAHTVHVNARRTPDRIALAMHRGQSRSYATLAERSARMAGALLAHGLAKGDRVAIWADTCLEYMETYLACAQAGLVVTPINARFQGREAAAILTDSGAEALVYAKPVEPLLSAALAGTTVRLLICMGDPARDDAHALEDLITHTEPHGSIDADDEDLFILGYTSGTTGAPKGAMLTHASVRSIGQTNALACRYALGSVQVFALSLSFSSTVPAHILPHLYVGGTTVMLSAWDTPLVIEAIEEHSATFLILPGPVIDGFARQVRQDPGRLRSIVTVLHSASKAPPEQLRGLHEVLGGRLVEGWGMTENSGGLLTATTAQDLVRDLERALASVGRPVPETEIEIIDASGNQLSHDGVSVGHLRARSRSLARGYWGNTEATHDSFDDGWYSTGDMGTIDRHGYIRIVDRRTDLINSGGMNIYPSEVEHVLRELPGVREAVVVGVPDTRWGQAPVAFIVAEAGCPSTEEMMAYCGTALASYKLPLWIRGLDEMPTNTGGKIVRQKLTALALGPS